MLSRALLSGTYLHREDSARSDEALVASVLCGVRGFFTGAGIPIESTRTRGDTFSPESDAEGQSFSTDWQGREQATPSVPIVTFSLARGSVADDAAAAVPGSHRRGSENDF